MYKKSIHILFLTAEPWPTFRPDVASLFGKYLPRHAINCDLVTDRDISFRSEQENIWGGGQTFLCNVPNNRAGQYLVKFGHNLLVLISMNSKKYDAIQVRDMSVTALIGLVIARLKGVKFFYWLSYPQSEGQINRARGRGFKGGMRFWFPLMQGIFGKWLLYKVVLPRADHVFVQSLQMQLDIEKKGIPLYKITPISMGVDTELSSSGNIKPANDKCLEGKRVLVYLGTLDRVRQIEILFQMLLLIKYKIPNIFLVVVGDTQDGEHLDWLKREVERKGLVNHILWTGWLSTQKAWSYVRSAEIGLSPFPRGFLLDSASPTKAIEYMALGLPVIVNDNPEQEQVIKDSGAGLCVKLDPNMFAESVIKLLNDDFLRRKMGDDGQRYIQHVRAYKSISCSLAAKYQVLFS